MGAGKICRILLGKLEITGFMEVNVCGGRDGTLEFIYLWGKSMQSFTEVLTEANHG